MRKTIFFATGRNGNSRKAVVIADDEREALLMLPGHSMPIWTLQILGDARINFSASEVISLVETIENGDSELLSSANRALHESLSIANGLRKKIDKVCRRVPIMGSTGEYRQGQLDALEACRNDLSEENGVAVQCEDMHLDVFSELSGKWP